MSVVSEQWRTVHPPLERSHERLRAAWSMWLFIATEGMLFALLFFGYFYLAASNPHWPLEKDPKITKALIMLGVLLASSVTAHWAQKGIERGNVTRLQIGLLVTLMLAGVFLYLTYLEYSEHLKTLTPGEHAYGSIFYTITTAHLAHLTLGALMLAYVLIRAIAGHFNAVRHQAVKNSVQYWHFVDLIWLLVVVILYLSPRFYGAGS